MAEESKNIPIRMKEGTVEKFRELFYKLKAENTKLTMDGYLNDLVETKEEKLRETRS